MPKLFKVVDAKLREGGDAAGEGNAINDDEIETTLANDRRGEDEEGGDERDVTKEESIVDEERAVGKEGGERGEAEVENDAPENDDIEMTEEAKYDTKPDAAASDPGKFTANKSAPGEGGKAEGENAADDEEIKTTEEGDRPATTPAKNDALDPKESNDGEGETQEAGDGGIAKYSKAMVRVRTNPADGSVAPVEAPRRTPDGRYARPKGRGRRGMVWDEVNGLWVPPPESDEEDVTVHQLRKEREKEAETTRRRAAAERFARLTLRLPPSGKSPLRARKLGILLRDDESHPRGLPIIMGLNPESPFVGVIPERLTKDYWVIGVRHGGTGGVSVTSSAGLQRELTSRRKEDEEVEVEISFERRSEGGGGKEGDGEPPRKRRRAGKEAAESAAGAFGGQNRSVKIIVGLPPVGAGKLGLIIQDDAEHYGLPLIMALSPESPFHGVIPPYLVQNYWVTGVKDSLLGEARTLNAQDLQRELTSRRRMKEENPVEVSFTLKQQPAAGTSPTGAMPPIPPQHAMTNAMAQQMALQLTSQQLLERQRLDVEAATVHARARRAMGGPANAREAIPAETESGDRDDGRKGKRDEPEASTRGSSRTSTSGLPPTNPKHFCKGLQCQAVDDYYADESKDRGFLFDKWTNFRGWRHKDCVFTEVYRKGRCTKCKSAYSNINSRRTPWLFDKSDESSTPTAVPSMEETLLPTEGAIRRAVERRMEELEKLDDVPNDPKLVLAARLMKMAGTPSVELEKTYFADKRSVLTLCVHCHCHMFKKKRANVGKECVQCNRNRGNKEKQRKKMEQNKEDRVAARSLVPFTSLSTDEMVQRFNALSAEYKKLNNRVRNMEGQDARAKVKAEKKLDKKIAQGAEFRAPLLPWPFYLNYNPVIAREYAAPEGAATARTAAEPRKRRKGGKRGPYGKRKAGSVEGIVVTESGRIGDIVPGSKGGEEAPTEEENGEEGVAAEEVADEPLEDASVGFSDGGEEEEGDVPPALPPLDEDVLDEEVKDALDEGMEDEGMADEEEDDYDDDDGGAPAYPGEQSDFDGQLV